jgi:adenosylmethionine-8-amino-7-oxononanoate aminotransferase
MGIWALGLAPGLDAPTVRDALLDEGVIARPVGPATLAFCPPLVISEGQMAKCVQGARRAVDAVAGA